MDIKSLPRQMAFLRQTQDSENTSYGSSADEGKGPRMSGRNPAQIPVAAYPVRGAYPMQGAPVAVVAAPYHGQVIPAYNVNAPMYAQANNGVHNLAYQTYQR